MNLKKLLIPNLPYAVIGLYATKLSEAWRLTPGVDFSEKLLNIGNGFAQAFAVPLPSFHPTDLCIGLMLGAVLRLAVHLKGKNAKKYRKNTEYGSARWGTHSDIAPFIDPDPWNNVILTKTESLTMSSRPKDPRNARNKTCWWSAAPVPVKPVFLSSPTSCSARKRKALPSWSLTRKEP